MYVFNLSRAASRVLSAIRGYFFSGGVLTPTFIGGIPTKSGVNVNEQTALRYAVVWACVNNIASDIAKLPSTITRKEGASRFIASEHDQYFLLTAQPNQLMSAYTFWKACGIYEELYGAAFVEIIRNQATDRPISYRLMCTPFVDDIIINQDGVDYLYWRDAESGRTIPDKDVLRFMRWTTDGINYKSPIQVFRETIAGGIAANDMTNELYGNGLRTDGYIQSNQPTISTEQASILGDNFQTMLTKWGIPVLPGTAEFKEFGMPLTDAQFIENRNYSVADICRIWRMPLHKVNLMENAIKSNIQEQNQEYVNDTLMPRIVNREQEINRKVFRDNELGVYQWDIETKGLLRGDHVARANYYKARIETGSITPDEVRAMEGENPLPSDQYGDQARINLNHIPANMMESWANNRTNAS